MRTAHLGFLAEKLESLLQLDSLSKKDRSRSVTRCGLEQRLRLQQVCTRTAFNVIRVRIAPGTAMAARGEGRMQGKRIYYFTTVNESIPLSVSNNYHRFCYRLFWDVGHLIPFRSTRNGNLKPEGLYYKTCRCRGQTAVTRIALPLSLFLEILSFLANFFFSVHCRHNCFCSISNRRQPALWLSTLLQRR